MRLGVLGGTFDPIHLGHMAAAEEVRVALGLDRVLFVPAGEPPHKPGASVTPTRHRLSMVEAAVASNPFFEVSLVDVDRPGPSYSVDTLRILREQLGSEAELYFIVGLDALAEIPTWRSPKELLSLCHVVAVSRPRLMFNPMALDAIDPSFSKKLHFVPMVELDISATDLRRRVPEGLPIKYLVPESVEDYIFSHSLYRDKLVAADEGRAH
ncbi:MAG: nicotinate-nucleotide adenylyltransferase [Chloroflexi bacterium]|nr:nicotinate-nucleotide adenylyltransferase [Chloroflexota bacterium]